VRLGRVIFVEDDCQQDGTPQRVQHRAEAVQPEQPAAAARIPHRAGLDHQLVELLRALHGDPGAEPTELAWPYAFGDRL
jgi:hypothetical protein